MTELEISEEELENTEGLMAKAMAALEDSIKARILRDEEDFILWGLGRKVSAETSDRCVMRGPKG